MEEFIKNVLSSWWGITATIILLALVIVLISTLFYRIFFKRFYGFCALYDHRLAFFFCTVLTLIDSPPVRAIILMAERLKSLA